MLSFSAKMWFGRNRPGWPSKESSDLELFQFSSATVTVSSNIHLILLKTRPNQFSQTATTITKNKKIKTVYKDVKNDGLSCSLPNNRMERFGMFWNFHLFYPLNVLRQKGKTFNFHNFRGCLKGIPVSGHTEVKEQVIPDDRMKSVPSQVSVILYSL